MAEITRLDGSSHAIEMDIVEREATPKPVMKLAVHLHLGGFSLSNTISVLDSLGISRPRSAVHNWVQKADLEPRPGRDSDRIALDETVVKVDGDRCWLFAAVEPETDIILHVGLYPTRTNIVTQFVLDELKEKHNVDNALFLVDGAPWLHAGLSTLGVSFRHETFGERNPVERVFQEMKRRTGQFYNTFNHADPETAESWLLALAWAWNRLI